MRVFRRRFSILATAGAALVSALLSSPAAAQANSAVPGDAYPLDYCIITGKKLGEMGKPVHFSYEGRDLRFCCPMCVKKFKADPTAYFAKLDAAIVKQQTPLYPLKSCVVSGESLTGGGMKPVDYVYKNRLVRLCCRGCIAKFEMAPAGYLKKLDEAVIKAQLPSYPLEICPVSKQKLGGMGEPVNYVHANRLVRFCCGGCIKTFRRSPVQYMAMLDKASAGAGHGPGKTR